MNSFRIVPGTCDACEAAAATAEGGPWACQSCEAVFNKLCPKCAQKPCKRCGKGALAKKDKVFPHSTFRAIADGDINTLRKLLRDSGRDLDAIFDTDGRSLLHAAAILDDKDAAESICVFLVGEGIPIAIPDQRGRTALMRLASSRQFRKKITVLLKGSENARDSDGCTALMLAAIGHSGWGAMRGNIKIAQELISMGADPLIVDRAGLTALGHAFVVNDSGQNLEMVEFLKEEMLKAAALREFNNRYSVSFDPKSGVLNSEPRETKRTQR